MSDLEQVKQELEKYKQAVKGGNAQLAAYKQMVSELMEANGIQRTNFILMQDEFQKTLQAKAAADKALVDFNAKIGELEAKIASYQVPAPVVAPPAEEAPVA